MPAIEPVSGKDRVIVNSYTGKCTSDPMSIVWELEEVIYFRKSSPEIEDSKVGFAHSSCHRSLKPDVSQPYLKGRKSIGTL